MDEDSLRNWGYYEPPVKGHLGLQLMPSMDERDTKPYISNRGSPVIVSVNGTSYRRDCMATEPPTTQMDYVRDSWINHREKFLHMFPGSPYDNSVLAEPSVHQHSMQQIVHQPELVEETKPSVEEPNIKDSGPTKKRAAAASTKSPKSKKCKEGPAPKENGNRNPNPSGQRARTSKKNVEVVINGGDKDITGIPIPVCSCTSTPQQCYRWGCGGWQSACCTTTISMYPLPMSTKRRGARIAGRKMSQGAFKKVLEKLASEGYDFTKAIDLKTYWAKHGTNKFVVIR